MSSGNTTIAPRTMAVTMSELFFLIRTVAMSFSCIVSRFDLTPGWYRLSSLLMTALTT